MAVKYTIEETLGLDEPYEPSPEVLRDLEIMRKEWGPVAVDKNGEVDGD